MRTAARARNNVIYSAWVTCAGRQWQLAAKRAGGKTTIFLQRHNARRTKASGRISGQRVSISAPARKMGCTRGVVSVYFNAKGTTNRSRITDRVPNRGKIRLRAG
jgi:hypothetical protein